MSKKVLLVAPHNYGLYKLIVKNLEFLGYNVVHIEDRMVGFKYKSVRNRLVNLFHKLLFQNKNYKEYLKKKFFYNKQLERIDSVEHYDVALVIRADLFDFTILEKIRYKTKRMISYHFDGIGRDLSALNQVKYFDKFYVFDKEDVLKFDSYNFLFSTNFYFDYPEESSTVSRKGSDVYFVSSYDKSRLDVLIKLHRALANILTNVRFLLVCKKEEIHLLPEYVRKNIEIVFHYVTFDDQLVEIAKSSVIIDLVIAEHNGLSFRVFEGLKYKKKVITTNKTIIDMDFYHPNNYFLLHDDNYSDLENFLQLPYVDVDSGILEKYSFTNWIKDKFNDE